MNMNKFLVVIEKAGKNFSAYCPDLPGCVATGITRLQAQKNIYEAIDFHLQGLKEDRSPIPHGQSSAEYVTFLKVA